MAKYKLSFHWPQPPLFLSTPRLISSYTTDHHPPSALNIDHLDHHEEDDHDEEDDDDDIDQI